MDRIAAMRAFVRVVETGSFERAAESLALSNAKVTRLIQGLEESLKVQLLRRTLDSAVLTAEGAGCYEGIVRFLTDLEDIESRVRSS